MKKLLLTLLTFSLAGCSSYDLTTPTQELLTGRWNLTAVEDKPLPYKIIGSGTREVTGDMLTLATDGTFTESTTIQITLNGTVTTQTVLDSGTYEFNSTVVTFHFQSNGTIGSGTMTGKKMRVVTSGLAFTYAKM
jgi:hypothetical protein